jgi:hypothetical protein
LALAETLPNLNDARDGIVFSAFLAWLIFESASYIEAQTTSRQSSTSPPGSHEPIISQISKTYDSFNPSADEGLEIRYTISRPGQGFNTARADECRQCQSFYSK